MRRIPLEGGGWFNRDDAQKIREDNWRGRARVTSDPAGRQWEHEELYVTRLGRFVLRCWSEGKGFGERYVEIDAEVAAAWLVRNDVEPDPGMVGIAAIMEALDVAEI